MPGTSRQTSWWTQKRDLQTLLIKFGTSKASDSRDIIYALLGMSSDACDSDILQPNYEVPIREAIRETISFLLDIHKPGYNISHLPDWDLLEFIGKVNYLSSAVLSWAMDMGEGALMNLLVKRDDIDVNAVCLPRWILQAAAYAGNEELVQLLINSGADIDPEQPSRRTALSLAAKGGHEEAVQLLINGGVGINIERIIGSTALSSAAEGGYKEVVQLLIDSGADINKWGAGGWTALSLAAKEGHKEWYSY